MVQNIDNNGQPGIIQGYGTLPYPIFANKEGVVVAYDWFGDYTATGSPLNSTSRGFVLVHEMGHYLGLYHPFEGGCNIDSCATQGDMCCDVPQTSQGISQCNLPQPSCTTGHWLLRRRCICGY